MLVTGVTTATCSAHCLIPHFSAVVHSPASTLSFRTNELTLLSINPRTRGPSFFLGENCLKLSTFCGVQWENWASSIDTQRQGVWEDPDDGGDSDYGYNDEDGDEDGESEENGLEYESDWENQERNDVVTMAATTATAKSTTYKLASTSYEKDLVEEIEHILSPEEKEILAQNKAPNLSKISTAKWKPLQTLALSGQIHHMDKMLENGVDVDKDGRTALHAAVMGKKEPIISHLLRKGANPHIKDQGGASALHYAVQVGAMQTVKLLVKYNVDVNVEDICSEYMEEEKDVFYVVRKGDIIDVYKNFSDCQAQLASSVCDPAVSVFKGYGLTKEAEEHLVSHGLRNAAYAVSAVHVQNDLFGKLTPCPIQDVGMGSTPIASNPLKHFKSDNSFETKVASQYGRSSPAMLLDCIHFCYLEFDGASKGNPVPAGAGAVLRAKNGNMICRIREGLGVVTNNAAEYRAVILGLKVGLRKGFKSINVQGDSKLVCMQIEGKWKVNNQNIAVLCKEAKELMNKFTSFEISHVLREFNSFADEQSNLAVNLRAGQVEEDWS